MDVRSWGRETTAECRLVGRLTGIEHKGFALAVLGGQAVSRLVERQPVALDFRNVRAGPKSEFADRIG